MFALPPSFKSPAAQKSAGERHAELAVLYISHVLYRIIAGL